MINQEIFFIVVTSRGPIGPNNGAYKLLKHKKYFYFGFYNPSTLSCLNIQNYYCFKLYGFLNISSGN